MGLISHFHNKNLEIKKLKDTLEFFKAGTDNNFSSKSIKKSNLMSNNMNELNKNSSNSKIVQETKDIIRTIFQ